MGDVAVSVENLGKAYRIGQEAERSDTFVGALAGSLSKPFKKFRSLSRLNTFGSDTDGADILWALKDLSFTIKEGEVVGFVGRNGAGKSTLLKLLSRITPPTQGRIRIQRRVSSLLEVGTGFHPELTGRENIYMNGTVLGMSHAEIKRKFDEIIAFSGVERFLDTPVKRYSSGMKVRLGFSVAAHLEPEILIIDEVLAVGDAEFQRRCLGKMQDVAGGGRTVLFVSHNMGAVQNLCSRVISLRDGRMVEDGDPRTVVRNYLAAFTQAGSDAFTKENEHRQTKGPIHLTFGRCLDGNGSPVESMVSGEEARFEFGFVNKGPPASFRVRLIIRDSDGIELFALHSGIAGASLDFGGEGVVRAIVPKLPLLPGSYNVAVAVITMSHDLSDAMPNALAFSVDGSTFFPGGQTPPRRHGRVLVEHHWEAQSAMTGPATNGP
ncbi:ABC transporter ATP-binding protein [Pacificimonas sp. ICDLI1SI03]